MCVNVDLLVENLSGDRELARKGLAALARAVALATPTGKQNSFANRPRAYFVRAEAGSQQPRDLTGAFFSPVRDQPWERHSVKVLTATAENIDRAYGTAYDRLAIMDEPAGEGKLDDIAAFAASSVQDGT